MKEKEKLFHILFWWELVIVWHYIVLKTNNKYTQYVYNVYKMYTMLACII